MNNILPYTSQITEYARFYNRNYDIVQNLDEKLTRHNNSNSEFIQKLILGDVDVEKVLEGYNMCELFAVAQPKGN